MSSDSRLLAPEPRVAAARGIGPGGDGFGVAVPARTGRGVVGRFLRHRVASVSLLFLGLLAVAATTAPMFLADEVSPSLTRTVTAEAREGPSLDHLFGTDQLGRDQLARVLAGVRKSLVIGLGVAAVSALVGAAIGALAGWYGGWVDSLLMRFTDLVLVLPGLAVLLIVATNPHPSFFGLFDFPPATEVGGMIVVLSLLGWMPMARIVRGETLSLREREFVDAARASGASGPRIILRHLLPNAIGSVIVFATLSVGFAILEEATLSFLGAGIQAPDVSLGSLVASAEQTVGTRLAYLVYLPGVVLFLIVLAVNFVGDGLRDALDPRAHR